MLKLKTYEPKLFSDLIERIWILETVDDEVELVIPPNQYVNLIFPLNSSIYIRNQAKVEIPKIEGISMGNTVLTYPSGTRLIGVRFFAFGLYPFIQMQGGKIINNSVEIPNEEQIASVLNFSANDSDLELISKLNDFLKGQLDEKAYESILSIMTFYNQFRWNDEIFSIEEYCRKVGTNYTTLNRNFTRIVGTTAKRMERLIKFRKSLCHLIDSKNNLTSIGTDSGYFDQAHFIREFKMFLNQTPSEYKTLIKRADMESRIVNYNFKLF